MSIWYEITPADTLFFRSAKPMESGPSSGDILFPPPLSVLTGALRTAVLRQRGVSFADYKAGKCPKEVLEGIGACGEAAPFRVIAEILRRDGETYAPCPASWLVDKDEAAATPEQGGKFSPVGRSPLKAALPSADAATLFLHSSAGTDLPMVRAVDAKPLTAYWIRLERLRKAPERFAPDDLLAAGELYDVENRTLVSIDANRKAREGHLYSTAHIRLRPGVALLVGLDRDPGLDASGTLLLGGEQRICGYAVAAGPKLPEQAAEQYMSLAPLELTEALRPHVFAAAKPAILAGWDLAKGFHKPTTAWLPAGSVFTSNVNSFCIPLP